MGPGWALRRPTARDSGQVNKTTLIQEERGSRYEATESKIDEKEKLKKDY